MHSGRRSAHLSSSTLVAVLAASSLIACGFEPATDVNTAAPRAAHGALTGETHPFQTPLICERAPGSTLKGVLFDVTGGAKKKISEFIYSGNVGACELALRAARNGRVCIPQSFAGYTIRDLDANTNQGSYSTLAACTKETRGNPTLDTSHGYMDFIAPDERAAFVTLLPSLADEALDAVLHDPNTIWYDEASKVFVYQDSFGAPKGLRANRVGYDVGSTSTVPDIRALTEYFEPQKFKFPFGIAAGATFKENLYAQYFWAPPRGVDGDVKPVKIWRNNSHWQWVFPVGTVIGEVLHLQAPDDGNWYTFEVRTRTRTLTGWNTGVFRPYLSPAALAEAIRVRRPAFESDASLRALMEHLESPTTLTAHTMTAPSYQAIFPPLAGAKDTLPAVEDLALVKELLTEVVFENAMGTHWKSEGDLTTFAPTTNAAFHIVPRDNPAGMFALTETGCRQCHEQTSRPMGNLDGRVVLYGEIWGEDEIFTWHPFDIDTDTFSVADGNRRIHPRLVQAGLVEMSAPSSDPDNYRVLPKPYAAIYE